VLKVEAGESLEQTSSFNGSTGSGSMKPEPIRSITMEGKSWHFFISHKQGMQLLMPGMSDPAGVDVADFELFFR
jgi:hypothetical protein